MDNDQQHPSYDPQFVRNMIESFLRIGLIFLLLMLSYDVIRPFTIPILWGAIIAIAAFPLVKWLEPKLGNRRGLSVTLVCAAFIALLVLPAWTATEASIGGIKRLSTALEAGTLHIPPPDPSVAEWPVIGERVHRSWSDANADIQAFLQSNAPQIRDLAAKTARRIGGSLLGVLTFIVSIAIAGGFMTYAESCGRAAHQFFVRVGGLKPGGEWAPLTVATVRSVLQGVVGVAVIQTTLITVGLVVAGVPAAAVLSVVILVLAISQLPTLIVVLPIIIYVFSVADTTTAVIFMIYQLAAGASDNILKPMLMGRGLDIPMPVILIGSIGGMLMSGIIGLFAGAVVLSIWYKLFNLWLQQHSHDAPAGPSSGA